jgi:predicted ester cyclase
MLAVKNNFELIQDFWIALSGKEKTPVLLDKYITDPELKGHITFFEAVFPKYEMLADDFINENDKVVVRGRIKGTHRGNVLGMKPTGKKIEVSFITIYQIEDLKIAKSWVAIDNMELMNQLGVSDN